MEFREGMSVMSQQEGNSVNLRKLFLDFYSSEINTHGRLIIGFAVILFTIIEIKLKFLELGISLLSPQSVIVYFCIGVVSFAIWYSLFRLLIYGMMANAVVHMNLPQTKRGELVSMFASEAKKWVLTYNKKVLVFFPTSWFLQYKKRGAIVCSMLALLITILSLISEYSCLSFIS